MSLTPGTRLGPYEILAPLGAGGLGEVYRAKDTKLKREVAVKVLPEAFARMPVAGGVLGFGSVPFTVVLNWQAGLKK